MSEPVRHSKEMMCVAPMHRDLGCYLLRGMTPERIMANQLGRATGVTGGRDANLHGLG